MRSLIIIVCKPLPADIVELLKAYAKEVIQTLPFCLSDITFDERICHRSAHGRLNYFGSRSFPKLIEPCRIFRIPVVNQVGGSNPQILQPHGCVSRLLKNPFFIGMKCSRTHENPTASNVNKHQDIGINPPLPRQDGFSEKVGGNQRFRVGTDKQLPVARWMSAAFLGNRMMPRSFKGCRGSL